MTIENKNTPNEPRESKEVVPDYSDDVRQVIGETTLNLQNTLTDVRQNEGASRPHGKAIQRLLDVPDGTVSIANHGTAITVTLSGAGLHGNVHCRKMPNSENMIIESSGSVKGFGPMLYEIAMEEATKMDYWTVSDRSRVSDDAYRVWQRFYFERPDIEKRTLDIGEWYDGRHANDMMQSITEDESTWPPKSEPIWSLWTGYKSTGNIVAELQKHGRILMT